MKQSLQLKLGQQLTMTPQLQQAIRLLQLSTLDLQQEIQEALDSNPMLEAEEHYEIPSSDINPEDTADYPRQQEIAADSAFNEASRDTAEKDKVPEKDTFSDTENYADAETYSDSDGNTEWNESIP